MTTITYIALREIERAGPAIVAATDISADAVDDSFNSVTTNLSGLLAGQWVLVVGTVNAGWHQLAANSTATKITTTSALTTVAAGAGMNLTGYARGYGASYTLAFGTPHLDPIEVDKFDDAVAEDGTFERTFHRTEEGWRVETAAILPAQQAQWREFFHSTKMGEEFVFDAYGQAGSPVSPQTVRLIKRSEPRRVGGGKLFNYSFEVRV